MIFAFFVNGRFWQRCYECEDDGGGGGTGGGTGVLVGNHDILANNLLQLLRSLKPNAACIYIYIYLFSYISKRAKCF